MRRLCFAMLLLVFSTPLFFGCKTGAQTREAQADLELTQQKAPASAVKLKEALKEPQPGYNQEPADTLTT